MVELYRFSFTKLYSTISIDAGSNKAIPGENLSASKPIIGLSSIVTSDLSKESSDNQVARFFLVEFEDIADTAIGLLRFSME